MTAAVEFELDEFAISVVCDERVPMALTGPDRIEAIRRLSAKGLQPYEIADLLRTTGGAVSVLQNRNGIKPAPLPPRMWWSAYINPRKRGK